MAEEAEPVSRMGEVLTGELIGASRSSDRLDESARPEPCPAWLNTRSTANAADLPPLPTLFVVVDEFAELLQSHLTSSGCSTGSGRVGRSLRVHLLLATQSLQTGGVRIDKLSQT